MNTAQIEKNIVELKKHLSKKDFICDFLRAYGISKSTLTLLKKGKSNLAKRKDQLILKKKVFFQEIQTGSLSVIFNELLNNDLTYKYDPRFIIATDYEQLIAYDTKTKDKIDIQIDSIDKYFIFFLPLAGMEKTKYQNENVADVKAAEKMAGLYDQILKENKFNTVQQKHELNLFFSRMLFCFFAEDTRIFKKGLFTNSIGLYTSANGSDLQGYFKRLFQVLNTKKENRKDLPEYLKDFPYVNGGLFKEDIQIPFFSKKSRKMIISAGILDWANINPGIFGSMMQAVANPEQRSGIGMHYTSVPNIMKVIDPLLLDDLKDDFQKGFNDIKKIERLLVRLSKLSIFDPACGSGNFLIIAYKEIRKLEIEIFKRLQEINPQMSLPFSWISLSQFYGIEIDDFACEIAVLSLWLAEHQMNIEFKETFGYCSPSLPLKKGGNIVSGSSVDLDWEKICPPNAFGVYILGNPPYLGSSMQNAQQKKDMGLLFSKLGPYKNLDYIACWFLKGSRYVANYEAKCAFVSTNSITQGEQVALLWPHIFKERVEISFAYSSFKWENNAKNKAAVICNIIGLSKFSNKDKKIYKNGYVNYVKNISPYLKEGKNIIISRRSKSLCNLPQMTYGNKFTDGGLLILDKEEKESLLSNYPSAKKFIKKLVGSMELIKGIERWCLWIEDHDVQEAKKIPFIEDRLIKVGKYRLASKASCTVRYADYPNRFKQITYTGTSAIVIPRVSSERREYIPFGFVDNKTVVLDSAQAIYDPDPYIFGIISSKMHMIWVKATAGRLKSDYRYSSALCYNTFPVPELSEQQKKTIQNHVFNILDEREYYSEKTKAELYDPDKMPDSLREAHQNLDKAVELCYRATPFKDDEERLEHLLKLYEKLMLSENK